VDFVLSNNYALIFADNIDEGLICYNYDYDANSTRIIPLFPVENNKIIIPENYYKVVAYSDDSTSVEPCCRVLSYLEDYNCYLTEDEKYLAFSDGMEVELLEDYFNLLPEKKENPYVIFLYAFACIGGLAFIFFKYYLMVFGLIIAVVFLIIYFTIYFIRKKIKRKKT